jgi:hypothetical protein
MDIKVDAPPYQIATIPTSKEFDGISDESPKSGELNHVYVRVRNRGSKDATQVKAKIYWAPVGTAVPALPSNFWTGFATNTFTETDWHFIGEQPGAGDPPLTVPYSGCTTAKASGASASAPSDDAKVQMFEWTAPAPDPSIPNHYCLFAIVDSPDDHVSPYEKILKGVSPDPEDFDVDQLTPSDNNASHRNYNIEDTSTSTTFTEQFYVRNPLQEKAEFILRYTPPPHWHIRIIWPRPPKPHGTKFTLGPGEQRLAKVKITTPKRGVTGTVTVYQDRVLPSPKGGKKGVQAKPATKVAGGFTINFRPAPP